MRGLEFEYLPWALADFSGYIAVDELYEGRYCILSIVDNRTFKRLLYEVLDCNPTHQDIERFFSRFRTYLTARGFELRGITTDGSSLYPQPISTVFGKVPHQLCQFHFLNDFLVEILAVAAESRRQLKAQMPKRPHGRPTREDRPQQQRKNRLQQQLKELRRNRRLFIRRSLSAEEKQKLLEITEDLPRLRTLRDVMDQVYGLFERGCQKQEALEKLSRLQAQVSSIQGFAAILRKLLHPNLEKALTFLNDPLLPTTSNAAERSNRRYRKMQKSIYRVRTRTSKAARFALDLQREKHTVGRNQVIATLHLARRGVA